MGYWTPEAALKEPDITELKAQSLIFVITNNK
jgi:hypothetical protein